MVVFSGTIELLGQTQRVGRGVNADGLPVIPFSVKETEEGA